MRREGKGTGQIDRAPAAADVPVVIEKKIKQCAVLGEIQQPPLWLGVEASLPGDCIRVLPLLQHYSAGGRVHDPGSWSTYPSSSPPPHPPPACHWNGLLQLLIANVTTTRNVQNFTAADILASRLVLTTGGSATPTPALILLPGNALLNGYSDARLAVDNATD